MSVCFGMYTGYVLERPEEGVDPPPAGVTNGCELLGVCVNPESNPPL